MKRLIVILSALAILIPQATAQGRLPSVNVKTPAGKHVNIQKFIDDGVPVIISFWSLTCKPCIQEINAINDLYDEWREDVDFKMIIVSIDDARNSSKAAGFARGKGWDNFTLLLDANQDLKRAMNVDQIPTVFVVKPTGEIAYRHIGYSPGNEQELMDFIKTLK